MFVFELTRDYNAILPLMLATVLAEIVTRVTLRDSLMTEKLSRRRVSVPGDYGPDIMATTRGNDIMTTALQTGAADATGPAAPDALGNGRHNAPPGGADGGFYSCVAAKSVAGFCRQGHDR